MGEYRCYLLDGAGAIRFIDVLRCEDDVDALSRARESSKRCRIFKASSCGAGGGASMSSLSPSARANAGAPAFVL